MLVCKRSATEDLHKLMFMNVTTQTVTSASCLTSDKSNVRGIKIVPSRKAHKRQSCFSKQKLTMQWRAGWER